MPSSRHSLQHNRYLSLNDDDIMVDPKKQQRLNEFMIYRQSSIMKHLSREYLHINRTLPQSQNSFRSNSLTERKNDETISQPNNRDVFRHYNDEADDIKTRFDHDIEDKWNIQHVPFIDQEDKKSTEFHNVPEKHDKHYDDGPQSITDYVTGHRSSLLGSQKDRRAFNEQQKPMDDENNLLEMMERPQSVMEKKLKVNVRPSDEFHNPMPPLVYSSPSSTMGNSTITVMKRSRSACQPPVKNEKKSIDSTKNDSPTKYVVPISPTQRQNLYKQIQNGGDIPVLGLRPLYAKQQNEKTNNFKKLSSIEGDHLPMNKFESKDANYRKQDEVERRSHNPHQFEQQPKTQIPKEYSTNRTIEVQNKSQNNTSSYPIPSASSSSKKGSYQLYFLHIIV
ncbi:hypothetical protein SNEBB_008647 [Seison nebaliae]|nr:hypothetical protein SNEBB_008647 [Seison nebaliae]